MRYSKYSGRGNFFSLPNEVFLLGLSAGELSVYSFLKRCENRKTHQCWPSIKTIGQAVRMSENTYCPQVHPAAGGARTHRDRTHRGDYQGRRKAQRQSAVHPPADPGGDRRVLRPPVGGIGVGYRAPARGHPPAATGKPRVTACEPLCGPITGGAEPLPLPASTGRIWAIVPPLRRSAYPWYLPLSNRFTRDEKKSRINAGVASGSSGRSLRPAVRVVTGFCGVSKVGSKTGSGDHVCGHNPRTPTAITKK